MTSRTKLRALPAGALALSLVLAGCGGGSSGGPASTVGGGSGGGSGSGSETPPSKTALSYATDLNASVAALMALSGDACGFWRT